MAFKGNDVLDDKRTDLTFRGQPIILSKTRGAPKKGLVAMGIERGMYPPEKMIEAATIYAATGSLEKTAELTKVPEKILSKWRRQPDFQALLREVWEENNEKIDARLTRIIEKSLDALLDRLDNGDFHVTRDGKLVRKPISAKELSLVQAINVDKRQLLRGLPTSRSEGQGSPQEKLVQRLEKLASTFEDLAKHGRRTEVIDIVDVQEIENHAGEGRETLESPSDKETSDGQA